MKPHINMISLFIGLCIILIAGDLKAEIRVRNFDQMKNTEYFKAHIEGVGQGFTIANAYLEVEKKRPLFCTPGKLILGADNYIQLIDATMKNDKYKNKIDLDTPIVIILFWGLQDTFPCK